ncbi:hypothetical protein C922_00855 [Plasmodium inui San Antonio 1]|uniref:Thiamine phosphate synthase/TenI domain-containing protein n=1 Tax=Plasmodium inui San Antonio 1 TaxID=1237626 RepID=W7AHE9_9APIC|nr:hypothetical protein C922_00855 [Plasmodium inui San Antonio 1]EUD68459.1 hypothetical protein C922_00855 [Plasmodium inui San Antonio 1]
MGVNHVKDANHRKAAKHMKYANNMENPTPLRKLNDMLKCDPAQKHRSKNKARERYAEREVNKKYLNRTKQIGRKYIEQVMTECGADDITDDDWESFRRGGIPNEMKPSPTMRKEEKDFEFTPVSNAEIDPVACKVKGGNLYEGIAGVLNQVVIETVSKTGECIYVENYTFEAYVKEREKVDKLNYQREQTQGEEQQDNRYDLYIRNNLYNQFQREKHETLINLDHNRYNINANFSNYKHVGCEERESSLWGGTERDGPYIVAVTEGKRGKSGSLCRSPLTRSGRDETGANTFIEGPSPHVNNNTENQTMREGYMFESEMYDSENMKLTQNSFKCNISDLKNGTYVVTYNLGKCGYYYLSIFCKKKAVANSPYLICIKPNVAYAPNCVVYKRVSGGMVFPAIRRGAGKRKRKLHTRGRFSRIYNDSLRANEFDLADSDGCESGGGSSSGSGGEEEEDEEEDEAEQDDDDEDPPMHILKYDAGGDPGDPVASCSDHDRQKQYDNFFIQSYDAYGNAISEGGDSFEAHALGGVKIVRVNDLHNGSYEVIYRYVRPTTAADEEEGTIPYRQINVTLNGWHVKGSPFRIVHKKDKQVGYLQRIRNLLPIDEVNLLDPLQSLLRIMQSYQYVKENYLDEKQERYFMQLSPYYEKEELNKLLRKVDPNMVSLMSIPLRQQILNHVMHINNDRKLIQLKEVLFRELSLTLGTMVKCANSYFDELEKDKVSLLQDRRRQDVSIREANTMYESLKDKNIHSLPFDFSIKDMKIYEQELALKKKELLEKQTKLINRYNSIRGKEKKFYQDREEVTNQLTQKYELHQAIYEHSQRALIHTNGALKKITISNIKRNCSAERGVLGGKVGPPDADAAGTHHIMSADKMGTRLYRMLPSLRAEMTDRCAPRRERATQGEGLLYEEGMEKMKKSSSLPGLLGLPDWPSQSRRSRLPRFHCFSTRSSSSGKHVDYSLYLVTDDKFFADKQNVCRTLIGKVLEGVLGGVGLVQLRLKKADDRYFYNAAVRMKQLLGKYKVPLIINNRIDICLGVDADGVHVGRTDVPMNVARDILGEDKIIGATINFSNDEDIQMALNSHVDYIVHEHTLYESTTKQIAASHHEGLKQQIRMLHCRIKHLQETGKIYKPTSNSEAPPIILIGGINTNNIEETMTHFCHSCAGVAVVSNLIGEKCNSFFNSLRLRFVIDKNKKGYNDAFVNLCVSCLRHVFWTNLEGDMKGAHTTLLGGPPMETPASEEKAGNFRLATNMHVKRNVLHFFENNLDLKIVQLNQPIVCSSAGGGNIFLFCSRPTGVTREADEADEADEATDATEATETGEGGCLHGEGKRMPISHDPCVTKWIQQNKKIANGVFILIGADFLSLFRKFLAPDFFHLNNFVVITTREQSSWETLRCDLRGVSIQFSNNLINVALKNIHVDSEAVNRFAILLAYFLMVQEKMKRVSPQFLTQIVGTEGEATADAGEEGRKLLKLASAVNMSFEVLSNEHTGLGLAAFST